MKIKILILALAALLLMTGCADIKRLQDLKVDSVAVEEFSPKGFRGATLVLVVDIDNPGAQVSLSEISGTIEHSGKVLGKVALDPFTLQGKAKATYRLNAGVTLGEDATIFSLGKFLDKKALDEMTVDLSADVCIKKGKARNMEINDLPLTKLM